METKKEIKSEKELRDILKTIPYSGKEQRNSIVCSLIGCSRISTVCFGYRYCARCGDQIGDNLGSIDAGRPDAVVIGHNCKKCRANYKKCTWKDKVFVKNPFPKKKKKQVKGVE